MNTPLGLTPSELATLEQAIRIVNARPVEHVDRDTCQRCGGYSCDECATCDCPRDECRRRRAGQ